MKRLLSVILTFALLLSLCTNAFAENRATLVVTGDDNGKIKAGDVLNITATIPAINNLAGISVKIGIDTAYLEVISLEIPDQVAGYSTTKATVESANTNGTISLVVAETANFNMTEALVMKATVQVKDAEAGEITDLIVIKEYEVDDADSEPVANKPTFEKTAYSFTIVPPTVPVTSVTLDKTALELTVGDTATLTATVTPDTATDKNVTWTTSNDKIATVKNGTVTAVSEGEATITAKAGDVAATCKVTVTEAPCQHTKLKEIPAKDATCTEAGNIAYWTCPDCNKLFSDAACTKEIEKADTETSAQGHDYGTLIAAKAATCTEDGNEAYYQCSRCSKYFDENKDKIETPTIGKLGHDIEHHPYVAATCVKTGSNEYWSCKRCDGKFADGNGDTQFTGDIVISVNDKNHAPSDTWTWAGDNEEHWKICPDCKAIMSITVDHHTASGTGEATCVGNATCDICKKSFGNVNPNNHASKLVYHEEVAATCKSTGTIEYWSCASCNKNFSDAEGKTEISDNALVIAKNPDKHTGEKVWTKTETTHEEKWSCCDKVTVAETAHTWDANGVCAVCDYKCKHVQASDWYANETNHWQVCKRCNAKFHDAPHTADIPATCTTQAFCHACGNHFGTVNSENHTDKKVWTKTETTHEQKWSCCNAVVVAREPHEWKDGTCSECGYVCQHTGGTATCKEKATCEICGQQYGELAAHKLTKTAEYKAATCTEDGNIAYWTCSVCKKLFSDENGTTKIEQAETVINALGHDYAAAWKSDGTKHWRECTRCHDKKDVAAHTGGTATCAAKAKCDVCAAEYGTTNPAKHSDIVNVPAKAHTCTEDGNIEHYKCEGCGKLFSDANGEHPTTEADIKDAAHHTLTLTEAKAATCLEPGNNEYYTCSVCKKVFQDAAGTKETTVAAETVAKSTDHATTITVVNADGHYTVCSVCGTVIEKKVAHTFDTTEGSVRKACHSCHYVLNGVIMDHQHTAGTDLTCDETSHWYVCTDANCDAHVGEVAHDYGTETTVTEGNTTITVKKCQTCGYVKRTETTNTTPVNPGGNTSGGSKNNGKTVESGKTFDAGIGLYVGLSLLSLTGSAVVIGKKRKTR